jgi:hypothetical protein
MQPILMKEVLKVRRKSYRGEVVLTIARDSFPGWGYTDPLAAEADRAGKRAAVIEAARGDDP